MSDEMLTIERSLNVYADGIPQIINLSQYDDDFSLVFSLYTSEGVFTVPSGTTAEIMGTKVDGNGYSADATVSGNTVTVTGNNQMTACAGRNIFEIVLTKSGKRLATINFILQVERAALDADTIQSETVLKELNAIIESASTATQAAEDAEGAADRAEEAAAYSESLHDIMVTSMASHVDVCRNNDVLTDANNAEVNSIYRLYFRWNETLLVDNLPITKSYSTMGTLFTFGEKSNSTAFRVQILIDDSDGIYFRYGTSNGYDSWHTIYDMRKTNYVVISATDDVIQKLIDANKDNDVTDVYFNDGDYDVIELYKRHYGSDFFDNYTGYDSGTNSFGRGLALGNGKHYHFADQALFHAEYTGSNTNVTTYFSMFAPEYGGGYIIDGLKITACSNLRYAVHADFVTGAYNGGVGEFRNCHFNTSDRCIGAGLHNGAILKLTDSVFIQTSDIVPVHVHSPNTQGASGRLIVNGCYFSNRLQIGRGGSNTTKSTAIVSNSSLINLVNENSTWDVISFNIDKR